MDLGKFRTLARNWEAFGHADPFFGVLSDPTKYRGKWEIEEFFGSGRAHVQHLIRSLEDLRVSFERGACLDFGCGVGRLTFPLSRYFTRTVGVDVARSMVEQARRYLRPGDRCEFVVNRCPDLKQFQDSTFDVVHSCLVLQHVPPDIAIRYVGEFFRVCKPGGIVVFQLPAATISEDAISAAYALPESAHIAEITLLGPLATLESSARTTLRMMVTNKSPVPWRHDIPAGRHICVGNHWVNTDGAKVIHDDGRAWLPRTLESGESVEVSLNVQAPAVPGHYELEIDLVQEHICWFANKGSQTARAAVEVTGPRESSRADTPLEPEIGLESAPFGEELRPRPSLIQRALGRLRGGTPSFEMHTVRRPDVEKTIRASGGILLGVIDDNAAGARWLSYTYVCRRSPPPPV